MPPAPTDGTCYPIHDPRCCASPSNSRLASITNPGTCRALWTRKGRTGKLTLQSVLALSGHSQIHVTFPHNGVHFGAQRLVNIWKCQVPIQTFPVLRSFRLFIFDGMPGYWVASSCSLRTSCVKPQPQPLNELIFFRCTWIN